ncbi:hypothetical protein [Methanosarcina barkeri]|uniref:hypothetical protein n=1 Tax=Methanosarcina barkeri TaxID=2208 RepID=UPI00003C639C|nr:hypothetical protein [Methanosarcina barkeri]
MAIFCSAVEFPCKFYPCCHEAGHSIRGWQYSGLAVFGVGVVGQSKIFLSAFARPGNAIPATHRH